MERAYIAVSPCFTVAPGRKSKRTPVAGRKFVDAAFIERRDREKQQRIEAMRAKLQAHPGFENKLQREQFLSYTALELVQQMHGDAIDRIIDRVEELLNIGAAPQGGDSKRAGPAQAARDH